MACGTVPGCGCGHCKGEKQGYTYVYPDGHSMFHCGLELISIFDYVTDDLPEFTRLMKARAALDLTALEGGSAKPG